MRRDWNRKEIDAAVEAYFWMLGEQVAGRSFSKADMVRGLQFGALSQRNLSSITRKFSNISAILAEVGAPWVRGYKPLSHVQRALQARALFVAPRRGLRVQEQPR